ncbi:MAG: TRAP transporter large permease subunit [Puniceicoccales bacterium]|nr:TRAP transporter large permease subunit [Puniceicoccales bacterium]
MDLFINPVFGGVAAMLLFSLLRVHVTIALLLGSLYAGLLGGMALPEIFSSFQGGLAPGAAIAVNYALLGAFVCSLADAGLVEWVLRHLLPIDPEKNFSRWRILLPLTAIALLCKNLVPVHIAFIPVLIPPLLAPMARLGLDRRAVSCGLSCGLVTAYVAFPIGFGHIFLCDILVKNLRTNGLAISTAGAYGAVAIPIACVVVGLVTAFLISYGRKRTYDRAPIRALALPEQPKLSRRRLTGAALSLIVVLAVQLLTGNNMLAGIVAGILTLWITGTVRRNRMDMLSREGIRMMAPIATIMIIANGFSAVLRATGGVTSLSTILAAAVGGSRPLAAFLMLAVGTFTAVGIGSSFATIPIVAAVYVPLCTSLGFSPTATAAIVAFSAVPGDPASPVSDSNNAISSGLSADGQFDHLRDCVLPSILHCALPYFAGGWIASMVL